MQTLPFEILRITFKYLKTEELLQCQLTSKEWYTASVELLYSDVLIDSNRTCSKYVRTILSSPRLGGYLQQINTGNLFEKPDTGRIWDECNLMNVLTQYCPNLLKLKSFAQDPAFWHQISFAAAQGGQLSRLQCLPEPSSENLEFYLYAALSFKASLTTLFVKDFECFYGSGLHKLMVYQKLQNEIIEFKHLQHIYLQYDSNENPLSYFDEMIEDCPHLKELELRINPETLERITLVEPRKIIKPRSCVSKLKCNWEMLDSEDQIKYLIQKFPNLDSIEFSESSIDYLDYLGYTTHPCPSSVVIEFLHFISAIPYFDVMLPLKLQDLKKAWVMLIHINDAYRDLTIDFSDYYISSKGEAMLNMKTTSLTVNFDVDVDVPRTELPSTKFFSEIGSTVRSLEVLYPDIMDDQLLIRRDDVLQIIALCPSLQELKLYTPIANSSSTNITEIKHTQMKMLSITKIMHPVSSLKFLEELSPKLPNLKRLELSYSVSYSSFNEPRKRKPVTVRMPNISLDQLISVNWDPYNFKIGDSFEAYIRLKTDMDLKFYVGNRFGLLEISEQSYNLPNQYFSFDITCQSLKEMVIRSDHSPHKEIKWIF